MIEIKYNGEKIEIFHEGISYTENELIKHLDLNGHEREFVSYAVPFQIYPECQRISGLVDKLFNEKKAKIKSRNI